MAELIHKVPINWEELELAVERNSPGVDSFLHLPTGAVLTISAHDPDVIAKRKQVSAAVDEYLRIEPASSREQYRWMERFVGSVGSADDDTLRNRLRISIDGKGAFRRFKDVLLGYPAERERWFAYRAEHLHWHIHNWLKQRDIVPDAPPPWGQASEPEELPQVNEGSAPVVKTEPPGEALRRQARDLIDNLAAIELPTAIAFLEFLRDRGKEALVKEPPQSMTGS